MIKRWDELVENYLNEEFFNIFLKKENSYAYLPKNNSVQFWGDYQSFSLKEKNNIALFIKNYFSKMTIAQVVTLNDIVPTLNNSQINQKLIGFEHGYSTEMFNADIIRYATSELSNYLLSNACVEMLSDYKSIMFASEIIINSNKELDTLDFNVARPYLSDNQNNKDLVGLGMRGRAELWRVVRPGTLAEKDMSGNQLFSYQKHMGSKSNGLTITESGIFKYRLHDNLKDLYLKSFFGKMFDIPLDKNFESEINSQEWKSILADVFEVMTVNQKNDFLNIFIDTYFPGYKALENSLNFKLLGFVNYKNIEITIERISRAIDDNFSYKLNGQEISIKSDKVNHIIKKEFEGFFTSREAIKGFNFSGLEYLLSSKSSNVKLLNFFKKYDIFNFNKDVPFKGFTPKIMSYKDEPQKKYIVVDFGKLWVSNVSANSLISENFELKNKSTLKEKLNIFSEVLEELKVNSKNEFKYFYVINLYRENNNLVIPLSETEINDLTKIIENVVISMLDNKNLSVDEMLVSYEAEIMKRQVKSNVKNKEKLRKF